MNKIPVSIMLTGIFAFSPEVKYSVLILSDKGLVSLDVEYIDGTKIESKANKYTFVWRKSVEKNRSKLIDKIKNLLGQIDESIAQDNAMEDPAVEFTPGLLT